VVSGGLPNSQEIRARLTPQVLRGLIDEQLQLQEADRVGITVPPEEIERGLSVIAERNGLSASQLVGALEQRGASGDALRRQIEAQIAWAQTVGRVLQRRVVVTQEQVDLAAQAFERGRGRPEFFLREIVLPVYDPQLEGEVRADAERLVSTIRQGSDFGSLAAQVSASATAEQGGAIGWVRETELAPEVLAVVHALQPGQVSRPVRTPSGFTIYFVESRRIAGGTAGATTAAEVELAQILFPAPASAPADAIARLQSEAADLRAQLRTCGDVDRAAQRLGLAGSGNLGWLRTADLPAEIGAAIAALPISEISQPVRGPGGVHLLMVCDRRGGATPAAATATSDVDPTAIRQALEAEQLENLARRYLRDLRRQAFVDIRI
jgi:peptidyl-prolyl cis-trans isomerase SurA